MRTSLLFLAAALVGGCNAVGVHFSNQELAPLWGAGTRFLAAGAIFLVLAAWRDELPSGRAMVGPALYGVFGFGLAYGFVYWGMVEVAPALAQVLLGLVPLATLGLSILQRVEAWRARTMAGALVAVVGIAVVFWDQVRFDASPWRLLSIMVGTLAIAQSTLVIKRFPRQSPFVNNGVGMLSGTIVLLVASLAFGEEHLLPTAARTWAAWGYLVTMGSVGMFLLFLGVLNRWPASTTNYLFLLYPLVTAFVSMPLTGETISISLLAGGTLVLAGVYVGAIHRPTGVQATPR